MNKRETSKILCLKIQQLKPEWRELRDIDVINIVLREKILGLEEVKTE